MSSPLHPILDEIYSGKEITYSMFKMKLDISGYKPDERFFMDFLYIVLYSVKGEKLFIDCVRHGMFVKFFKNWNTFHMLLGAFSKKNSMGLSINKILSALCERKPGILIGHFLRNGRLGVGKVDEGFEFFEDMARFYSEQISRHNEEYRDKIHPMVMKIIEDNRNFELLMN
jgi:hypothetical protein